MSHQCKLCADCESVSETSSDSDSDDGWSDGSRKPDDEYSSDTETDCSYCEHEARNDAFKRYDDDDQSKHDDEKHDDRRHNFVDNSSGDDDKSDNLDNRCDKNRNDDGRRSGYRDKKCHSRKKRFIEHDRSDENDGSYDNYDHYSRKNIGRRKKYEEHEKGDRQKEYDVDEIDNSDKANEDEVKKTYKGFDGYPPELQQFIMQKHKGSILACIDADDGDSPSKNNHLEALMKSFGGMMKDDNDEEQSSEAIEDDLSTTEGSHNRSKRSITSHQKHHHHSGQHRKHGGHHRKHGGHHRRHGGHHHRHGGHHHRRHRRSVWRMTKIVCPTGKNFAITMPARERTGWRCGYKTSLITLNKNGRMGRREYNIVAKEMDKSKQDHNTGKFSKYEIIKIQKIVNPCLWKRYRYRRRDIIRENGNANDRLLWHGSTHVLELVQTGFDERHANPNGMFGAGLYFAINSSKSNQYVYPGGCPTHKADNCPRCERNILLCRVSLGKIQQYTTAHNLAHPPVGYHSVEGVPGVSLKYSENIVYRGEQIYPEYLITYKLVP